jgi:hypothetical protein
MDKSSLFYKVMFEAPGDPPDMPSDGTGPPDIPSDTSGSDNTPPDLSDGQGSETPPDIQDDDTAGGSNDPPDLDMDFGDGGDQQDQGFDDDPSAEGGEENQIQNLNFDEKISAIMNMNLYQRYLSLLNNIGGQLSMIKNNSDMLYTLSNNSLDIIESLKKLDENIRLYLSNYFLNENYSKNLLFFNKCLNLLKLLNDVFEINGVTIM